MLDLYWGCLVLGVIFAIATILFGDIFNVDGTHMFAMDHFAWLQPIVIVGGLTIFGGAGIILTTYAVSTSYEIGMLSVLVAVILSGVLYFAYVKPMRNCENSAGFFVKQLVGKQGEVIIPIPAKGCGEVLIKVGAGNTNQIAASYAEVDIPAGTQVVIVEIKDGVLYVSNDIEGN